MPIPQKPSLLRQAALTCCMLMASLCPSLATAPDPEQEPPTSDESNSADNGMGWVYELNNDLEQSFPYRLEIAIGEIDASGKLTLEEIEADPKKYEEYRKTLFTEIKPLPEGFLEHASIVQIYTTANQQGKTLITPGTQTELEAIQLPVEVSYAIKLNHNDQYRMQIFFKASTGHFISHFGYDCGKWFVLPSYPYDHVTTLPDGSTKTERREGIYAVRVVEAGEATPINTIEPAPAKEPPTPQPPPESQKATANRQAPTSMSFDFDEETGQLVPKFESQTQKEQWEQWQAEMRPHVDLRLANNIPYVLEVRYGEFTEPPNEPSPPRGWGPDKPSDYQDWQERRKEAFDQAAKTVLISVQDRQSGWVQTESGKRIKYAIRHTKDGFVVMVNAGPTIYGPIQPDGHPITGGMDAGEAPDGGKRVKQLSVRLLKAGPADPAESFFR